MEGALEGEVEKDTGHSAKHHGRYEDVGVGDDTNHRRLARRYSSESRSTSASVVIPRAFPLARVRWSSAFHCWSPAM